MDKKTEAAIQTVAQWMEKVMYEERTEWNFGNKHDRMREAYDLMKYLMDKEEV